MSDSFIQDNKLQMLGKITASLLHEIRNPLSAVKLNLDYLKMMQDEMSDEVRDSVFSCREAVERMEFLVNSLLDFSRKSQNGFEIGDINQITENALEILHGAIQKRSIEIEKQLNLSLPHFHFNRNKILQVFINLIANATEAVNEKGIIKIHTYKERKEGSEFVIWTVEDNGVGIKKENKKKIFNDFYTSKKSGTGLGLSVCKTIIEEHDAEILFTSEFGKGTEFKIKFDINKLRAKHED